MVAIVKKDVIRKWRSWTDVLRLATLHTCIHIFKKLFIDNYIYLKKSFYGFSFSTSSTPSILSTPILTIRVYSSFPYASGVETSDDNHLLLSNDSCFISFSVILLFFTYFLVVSIQVIHGRPLLLFSTGHVSWGNYCQFIICVLLIIVWMLMDKSFYVCISVRRS